MMARMMTSKSQAQNQKEIYDPSEQIVADQTAFLVIPQKCPKEIQV